MTDKIKPLPTDPTTRKQYPMFSGLIQYFPKACAAVSHQSWVGNQQHHPDKPLHWDRNKSPDHADCVIRHMTEGDWVAVAWRAMANLEEQIEQGYDPFGDI